MTILRWIIVRTRQDRIRNKSVRERNMVVAPIVEIMVTSQSSVMSGWAHF